MFLLVLKNAAAKIWVKMAIVAVLFAGFTYYRNGAIEWPKFFVAWAIAAVVVLLINMVREYKKLKDAPRPGA